MRHGLRVILRETVGALLQINPAIGLNLDGPNLKGGGERVTNRRRKPAQRSSITGGVKLPGALGLGPRGHGSTSQEHRE